MSVLVAACPPSASRSTTIAVSPSAAAYTAVARPDGPAPTTTTSTSWTSVTCSPTPNAPTTSALDGSRSTVLPSAGMTTSTCDGSSSGTSAVSSRWLAAALSRGTSACGTPLRVSRLSSSWPRADQRSHTIAISGGPRRWVRLHSCRNSAIVRWKYSSGDFQGLST